MLRIITVACALLALSACNHDAPAHAHASQQTGTSIGSGQANRAPENLERFGAASWLPADYFYFSAAQNLGGLIEDIVDSRTFQSLARLPMVLAGLGQLDEPLQVLAQMREQTSVLDDFLALGEQALDREIFVACGKKAESVHAAAIIMLARIMMENGLASLMEQPTNPANLLVEALLPHRSDLRMPPVVVGMRVADHNRCKKFLSDLTPLAQLLPGVVKEAQAPTGFQAWTIKDRDGAAEHLRPRLKEAGVSEANIQPFLDWIASQQLTVAMGMHEDYLLFSISDTLEHLSKFGEQPVLASVPVFRRLRERSETPLLTTYVSAGLRPLIYNDVDATAEALLSAMPTYPGNKELARDLASVMVEIDAPIAEPSPYLTVTYRKDGLESLTISERQNLASSAQPLSLLANAGPTATLAYASRAEPSIEPYKRWTHWARVFLNHFETTVVPQMPYSDFTEFETARKVLGPHLAEIDSILKTVLLPAIDEHESLLLLDEAFHLELDHDAAPVNGLKMPRLALMWRVKDSGDVVTAFERMRVEVQRMLAAAASENSRAGGTVPAPAATKTADGTLYAYQLPSPSWLQPCLLINGDRIAFALTPEHAAQLMRQESSDETTIIDLTKGASSASSINLAALSELLRTDAMHMLRWASQSEQIPAAQATLIWTHLEPALKALAAMRSYQSRTWHEGDETIQHSWLQVSEQR